MIGGWHSRQTGRWAVVGGRCNSVDDFHDRQTASSIAIVDAVRCAREVFRLLLRSHQAGGEILLATHEPFEASVAQRLCHIGLAPCVYELVKLGRHRLCHRWMGLCNMKKLISKHQSSKVIKQSTLTCLERCSDSRL